MKWILATWGTQPAWLSPHEIAELGVNVDPSSPLDILGPTWRHQKLLDLGPRTGGTRINAQTQACEIQDRFLICF